MAAGCVRSDEGLEPLAFLDVPKDAKFEDFQIHRLYGSGNFSQVYSAAYKGYHVALKAVNRAQCERLRKQKDVLMEKHIFTRLNSVGGFPRLHGTFKDSVNLYFVMDACDGGEVWEHLAGWGEIWRPRARQLVAQLVGVVRRLHEAGIVHRDLKAENLVFRGGRVTVIDFGTAVDLTRPDVEGAGQTTRGRNPTNLKHYVGTPQFMCPEAVSNQATGFANDLWSLGCTIFQLLCGNCPFNAPSEFLVYVFSSERQLTFPSCFTDVERDLVEALVRLHPAERLGYRGELCPDFDVILQHPFFNDLPDADAPLVEAPVKPKLLEKLAMRVLSQPAWESTEAPVVDESAFPPLPERERPLPDTTGRLPLVLKDISAAYRDDCLRCGGRRGRKASPADQSLSALLRTSYCDTCESTLAPCSNSDLELLLVAGLQRAQFTRFYRHTLGTRSDDFYQRLTDRWLLLNPAKEPALGSDCESDSSGAG